LLNAGELADNRDLRKPILRLADIGTLFVEVLMPLDAFGKLKVDEKVEVFPELPIGGRYTAKVKVIDRVARRRQRYLSAYASNWPMPI
jgi:hypothetical protein